jgi:hypothetical protein
MTVARRNSHLAVSHHAFSSITSRAIRGGSEEKSETPGKEASAVRHSSSTADTKTEFVKLADPAPGARK